MCRHGRCRGIIRGVGTRLPIDIKGITMAISDEYAKSLKDLHKNKSFGKSAKIPKKVREVIDNYKVSSLLDFGCGKGNTVKSFKEAYPSMEVFGYDPAMFPIELPERVDLIYSSDVLEHVEPELLQETLLDLKSRSKVMYHLIACFPAKKHLPDGQNAHLIIEDPAWWKKEIENAGLNVVHENIVKKQGKKLRIVYIVVTETK